MTRTELGRNPVKDMREYGTYCQPAGSWSDDTSLTLCLLDGIDFKNHKIDYQKVADNMVAWLNQGVFTANNIRFDVGITSQRAIKHLEAGCAPCKAGINRRDNNGNGSLMRISPLAYYLMEEDSICKRYQVIQDVVSMIHRHKINYVGCHIYVEFLRMLLLHKDWSKDKILDETIKILNDFYEGSDLENEYNLYYRITNREILPVKHKRLFDFDMSKLRSSGYIVDSLESSLYCFLTSDNYKDAVLTAVNLGEDTDTIAAITGSLSSAYYGYDAIPKEWIDVLLNKELLDRENIYVEYRI